MRTKFYACILIIVWVVLAANYRPGVVERQFAGLDSHNGLNSILHAALSASEGK